MKIELRSIRKHYGLVRANDGVSLVIESGTIHGLLGENGAGKTTLMNILSGFQRPDSGKILVDGRKVHFPSPARAIAAGIGMLHQDPLDVPAMTALDDFALGHGHSLLQHRGEDRRELRHLCRRFAFDLDPDALVGSLSIGERQQLELARLLSLRVQLVILDEPTTGISAPQQRLLFETLRRLAQQGLSVVFVSHKLDEVEELCQEVTVLRRGRVSGIASGPFVSDRLVEMMFGRVLTGSPRDSVPLGDTILELDDVSMRSRRLNVERVSLQVRAGEVIGLAGLEGSGQRSMMQAWAGLERVHSGRLLIAGQDVSHQPYRRFLEMGVAYLPAARLEEGMIEGLTIREHFALVAEAKGPLVHWQEAEASANGMIREFGIMGGAVTRVGNLSGGNQQRLILALLPDNVRLLILEHPTRGLDLESTRWVWDKLLQRRRRGTAIVFTSTDLDELVDKSDRILVFSGGRMSAPVDASDITGEQLAYLIGGRQI